MSNNGTISTARSDDQTNNEIGDGEHRRDESNNDKTDADNIANKKQKTSEENEYIEIWCTLKKLDLSGNEEPDGTTKIHVLKSSVISDIKDAVKAKFPIKLQNVDADDLQVFASNKTQTPLNPKDKWVPSFGEDGVETELIIKVPTPKRH